MTEKNSNSFFEDFDSLINELRNDFAKFAGFTSLCYDPYRISSSAGVYLQMVNTNVFEILKAR